MGKKVFIICPICHKSKATWADNVKKGSSLGINCWSLIDLMKHLKNKFKHGMNWDNYGEWHIDHIIPVAAFNMSSFESLDFKHCWAISNLQPLWKTENLKKNQNIDNPFQPSLDIAICLYAEGEVGKGVK